MPSFNPYASVDKNKANSVIISGVENSSTASQAYSAGDYLILNDVLYRVTSDIASAGSIITSGSGTNVIITTVTDELQDKVSYGDVVNNLTSTETDKPLSANMGKALNEAIQQSTATAFTQKDESASNIVSTGTEVVVSTKTITSPKASSNVLIVYSAPIKTSANTSTLYIKVDDTIVGNPMSTNQTAFITVIGFALASMAAGSHTVKLCMKSQNSSTTGTIPSYNSVAFAVVVL